MSDEPETYTAREIVLEFFPATDERILPGTDEYRFESRDDGVLSIHNLSTGQTLTMSPVAQAGERGTQVLCDLCLRNAPRSLMQIFRAEVPGSKGRRYRYVSLCRNHSACDANCISQEPLRNLFIRFLNS